MPDRYRQAATHALIAGLVMSVFGWFYAATGISRSDFYNTMVDVFYWMLRIGGGLLIVVAGLCALRLRGGLLADALVTGGCALVMLLYAASGALTGVGINLNHVIILFLGVMFLGSARASLRIFRTDSAIDSAPSAASAATASPVEPVHPASVHPQSLPEEDQPPPPDGYLAALSKEKDEPPTASYE